MIEAVKKKKSEEKKIITTKLEKRGEKC